MNKLGSLSACRRASPVIQGPGVSHEQRASPALMACNATLLKQYSKRTCTNEVGRATFGCSTDNHMWVAKGCRGHFSCTDASSRDKGRSITRKIQCESGTSSGGKAGGVHLLQNCSCRSGLSDAIYKQHPKPQRDASGALGACANQHRCPDTAVCPPSGTTTRVFEIQGGAKDAAFGNLFYSTVSNAVLYARHKGFVPWVRFAPTWTVDTMGQWHSRIANTTAATAPLELWERFFEASCPNISAWLNNCPNVVLVPPKPQSFYYPHIAQSYRWPIRSWYNMGSPARTACDETGGCDRFEERLFRDWRLRGASVVACTHQVRSRCLAMSPQRMDA